MTFLVGYSYIAIAIIVSFYDPSSFVRIPLGVSAASSAAGSETLIGIKGKDFVLLASSGGISGNGVAFTSTYIDKIHILQPSYANDDGATSTTSAGTGSITKKHHRKVPTTAIAAVGNYADIDHLIRRIRAEYNIYHYESLTYSSAATTFGMGTSRNIPAAMEIIDCRSIIFQSESSTSQLSSPLLPNTNTNSDDDDDDPDDFDTVLATVLSVDHMANMVRNQMMTKLRSATPYHICTLLAGIRPRSAPSEQIDSVHNDPSTTSTLASTVATTSLSGRNIRRKIELAEHLQNQVRNAVTSNGLLLENKVQSPHTNPENDVDVDTGHEHPPKMEQYEPVLYWLDEYGSMIDNIPYGVHGYASDMLYSILDQKYRSDLSKDDAVQLLNECLQQLQTRYMMNTQQHSSSISSTVSPSNIRKSFCIKLIDQYGCTQL